MLGVQLCSRPTPTQHAVACRQMLTQELLAEAAVIATQALSAGPAFHSRSAAVALVVRRQHLIVPQTKAVTVVEHRHQQTRTKIGTNPSLCVRMQAPHFCPGAPQPPNSAIPKYTQTPHFSLKILPNPSLFIENASKPLTFVLPPAPPPSPPIPRVSSPSSIPNDPNPAPHLHPILPSRTKPANPVSQPNPKGYAGSQPPLFSRSFSNSTSGSAVVSSVLFWPTVAAVPHSLLPAPCNC